MQTQNRVLTRPMGSARPQPAWHVAGMKGDAGRHPGGRRHIDWPPGRFSAEAGD